jgi:hypothetical protein
MHHGIIELSTSFEMGTYTSQCDFSGKTLMIKGQGQTLDANGGGRFFYGSGPSSSLEVHGLVLKNGRSMHGGAINIEHGTLVIHDSTFDTNIATQSCDGGAIHAKTADVKIYTCTFTSNTAERQQSWGGDGGAVYARVNAHVMIYTSTFVSNTAMTGGAIQAAINAKVELWNCTFNKNTAVKGGGVFSGRQSSVKIHGSLFFPPPYHRAQNLLVYS